MKKLLFSHFLFLISYFVFAQNVGIGMPNPNAKLHVGPGMVRIEGSATSGGVALSLGGYGEVQVDAPGVPGGRFTIKENDRVGIGLNNPQQSLSIKGGMNIDQTNLNDGSIGDNVLRFGSNSGEAIGSARTGGSTNQYGLDFYTNSLKRMSISLGGNIGIGTSTPGFPLNFPDSHGDKISFYGNTGAHHGIGIQHLLLQIHTDAANADIVFGYGSSSSMTETMRIMGNGNVGIGTGAPTVKLDVAGEIKANSYHYNSPKTHYYSVPATAFQSNFSSHDIITGTSYASYSSFNVPGLLVAPVYLPQGANITAFTVHFEDYSPTVELDVYLCLRAHSSSACTEMARFTSSTITGISSGTDNSIVSSIIDNQQNSYSIGVSSMQPGGGSANWPSTGLTIRSVMITYTLNEVQ